MSAPRDPDLETRLRQSLARRAETTTVGEPRPLTGQDSDGSPAAGSDGHGDPAGPDEVDDVAMLPAPGATPTHRSRRRWARPATAVAAAAAVLATGLVAAGYLTDDSDSRPVAGQPGTTAPFCGDQLPFDFPTPEGLAGPTPGSITPDMRENDYWNGIVLRWQGEGGTVDVYWPSYPPQDPTTPVPDDVPISISGSYPDQGPDALGGYVPDDTPDDWYAQEIALATSALGDDACAALGVIVTAPTAEATDSMVDQIATGLVGPDGAAPGIRPTLVTGTSNLDALPDVEPCSGVDDQGSEDVEVDGEAVETGSTEASGSVDGDDQPPHVNGGPVDGQGSYEEPRDALAHYLPTNLLLPQGDYEEASLPDGSHGYVYRPNPDDPDFVTVTIHVEPADGGWTVTSWATTGC
jgi:hypothetical protein